MHSDNSNRSCAARVFMALWAMLAMALAVAAEAAPFAYVVNEVAATVSVIDTATNTVGTTVGG
jgi:DNA-binding beta-propeller fold protein YncE